MNHFSSYISRYLMAIWLMNCLLGGIIAIRQVWIPYMDAGGDGYTKIIPEPFDGTIMPIAYVPDWTKTANQDKSKRFEDIAISEFVPIPLYDALSLQDTRSMNKAVTILKYTYFTTYMGTYRLDYREYAGSHLGVDIRAPIGTPVLSIANGVIIRISEGDFTGNKFIVVRHDGVIVNGVKKIFYSGFLHLSEILVKEGDKVRKGDMIGRVGMTGIATTPHLHFQIDTAEAPFHPYWPFTSSESRGAGVDFFGAVNMGLGKENAQKYTIHPMNFVNMYLGGVSGAQNPPTIVNTPQTSNITQPLSTTPTVITSYRTDEDLCIGKRFSDIKDSSNFGKTLYPLVDKKCIFGENGTTFNSSASLTYREALINTMRYFDIAPTSGTSHFLDIALGDILQGYALAAYRDGVIDGNYARPEKIITREELAILITKVAQSQKNPSQIKIYADVDAMNPAYQAIQDYGFMVRARGGRFFPKTIANRSMLITMLTNIAQ